MSKKRDLNMGALPIARDEYLGQLVSFLQPLISKGFWSIYQDSRKICANKKHLRFKEFQRFVKQIPLWSSLIVEDETRRIKEKVDCLSELITVIFVGNVKILASIRLKGEHTNIKVKIPSCNNFIHTVYINTAKRIYYNPLLFNHKCTPIETEHNMETVYQYIEKAIIETIQQMLPIKSILEEYLGNVFNEDVNVDEDSDSEADEAEFDDPDGNTICGDQIGSDSESESEADESEEKIINPPTKGHFIDFPKKVEPLTSGYLSDNQNESEAEEADEADEADEQDKVDEPEEQDSEAEDQDEAELHDHEEDSEDEDDEVDEPEEQDSEAGEADEADEAELHDHVEVSKPKTNFMIKNTFQQGSEFPKNIPQFNHNNNSSNRKLTKFF